MVAFGWETLTEEDAGCSTEETQGGEGVLAESGGDGRGGSRWWASVQWIKVSVWSSLVDRTWERQREQLAVLGLSVA